MRPFSVDGMSDVVEGPWATSSKLESSPRSEIVFDAGPFLSLR
jgi:hypothetical protein